MPSKSSVLWQLLHSPNINWEAVLERIEEFPAEARIHDVQNRTILRILISPRIKGTPENYAFTVKRLIEIYPDALKVFDKSGYLPIHAAAQRIYYENDSSFLIQMLLDAYPDAASMPDRNGRYALDIAIGLWDIHHDDIHAHMLDSERNWARLLSNERIAIADLLLQIYPKASLGRKCSSNGFHSPALQTLIHLWNWNSFYISKGRCLFRGNLLRLTEILIFARNRAYGNNENSLLHAIIQDKDMLLENKRIREYYVEENAHNIASKYTSISRNSLLHLALQNGYKWHDVVHDIYQLSPEAVETKDSTYNFYPFMLASIGRNANLTTIFELLRRCPSVITLLHN